MRLRLAVIWTLLSAVVAAAQSTSGTCPKLVSTFYADSDHGGGAARYEVRHCGSGEFQTVQIVGYAAAAVQPDLVVDTGATQIDLVIHRGDVLIVNVLDGVSSSGVYLLQFQEGRPKVVGTERTVGGIRFSQESDDHGDFIVAEIPPKVYPSADGVFPKVKPKRYRLRVQ